MDGDTGKMHSLILLLLALCGLAASRSLPQLLTEDQFNSSPSDERTGRAVRIFSGYSNIARYGRGFSNGPLRGLRGYAPVRIRDPVDLDPRNANALQTRKVVFEDDKAPVFDLEKMLKEQEIKRRIQEANRKALELVEKEKREEEERRRQQQLEEERKELEANEAKETEQRPQQEELANNEIEDEKALDRGVWSPPNTEHEEDEEDEEDEEAVEAVTDRDDDVGGDEESDDERTTEANVSLDYETEVPQFQLDGKFIRRGQISEEPEDQEEDIAEDEQEVEEEVVEEEGAAVAAGAEEAEEKQLKIEEHPPMEIDLGSVQEV